MSQHITDEQIGKLCRRVKEVLRRVDQGTLSFEPTMQTLQNIIEGRHEPPQLPEYSRAMRKCEAWNGNRCTVCSSFFGDGDDICGNGHEIGQTYPVG